MNDCFDIKVMDNNGNCLVTLGNKKIITTSIPKDFKGDGTYQSSTELLAISLATCIASSFSLFGKRLNIDTKNIGVKVKRTLTCFPKELKSIELIICIKQNISDYQLDLIKTIIGDSTVRRAISKNITLNFFLNGKNISV